jgi:quercetin dioxygenase-like cupin family protein
MRTPIALVCALATTLVIGTGREASAQVQAPPTRHQQPLRTDLAGMPGQETLVDTFEYAANSGTNWHIHPDGHEISYVLEGIWISEADGREAKTLKAGDSVYVPPNTPHRSYSDTSGPSRILVVRIKPKGMPVTTPFVR